MPRQESAHTIYQNYILSEERLQESQLKRISQGANVFRCPQAETWWRHLRRCTDLDTWFLLASTDEVRKEARLPSSLSHEMWDVVFQDGQELSALATPVHLPALKPACSLHKLTSKPLRQKSPTGIDAFLIEWQVGHGYHQLNWEIP